MKRNLLLCFDAFGTLFKVKQPIERQYGDVARQQFGLAGISDAELRASFRAAFKAESRRHPNYGHASGMGATAWWASVIAATFAPVLPAGRSHLPPGLVPALLERFATREAYTAAPQLAEQLRALQSRQTRYGTVVVGVITNSDDRVPGILSSLGLRVSPLRAGFAAQAEAEAASQNNEASIHAAEPSSFLDDDASSDIHFHCMSYDVGASKPDPRIFRAAQELLTAALARRLHGRPDADTDNDSAARGSGLNVRHDGHDVRHDGLDLNTWDYMYVGDEWDKDVVGAQAAGWFPVLLADDDHNNNNKDNDATAHQSLADLASLPPQSVRELAAHFSAVRTASIASLLVWLQR